MNAHGIQVTSWAPAGNARTVSISRLPRTSLMDVLGEGRIPLRWRIAETLTRLRSLRIPALPRLVAPTLEPAHGLQATRA